MDKPRAIAGYRRIGSEKRERSGARQHRSGNQCIAANMKKFTIHYLNQSIEVQKAENYQLRFANGEQLNIQKYPDDTQTTPVENYNISYSNAFVWVVENPSAGSKLIDKKQLQELGELIRKIEQELEKG